MKTIVVANQKGGVGKSTTAIMLAQELQRKKKKVLLIDSDPQRNTTSFYRALTKDTETLADILCGDYKAIDCIQHCEYGDIIPSDDALKDAENMVKPDEMRFLHLRRSCEGLSDLYDYIVIDTPPSIGVILKNALAFADEVIVPISEDGWSLEGLIDFFEAIQMAQNTTNANLTISGLLIVMHRANTKKAGRIDELASDLAEKMNTTVFRTKIRASVRCSEALTEYGVPLYEYAPTSTTQLDYEDFTKEFLKKESKR